MEPQVAHIFAPAKINLSLHVTGQRSDGYHLLDSLVAFADVGDDLSIEKGSKTPFCVSGPEAAGVPESSDNLVLKVAALMNASVHAAFELRKNLPVASGIGGGSADAAAAYRGLVALHTTDSFSPALYDPTTMAEARALLNLGADIPMCLLSQCARIEGIGELITPLPHWPSLHAVLVNPRRSISTPDIFRVLEKRNNPAMPETVPAFSSALECITWLSQRRNDLQAAAIRIEPAVRTVLDTLSKTENCRLARMSGSGATCFGLFVTGDQADDAAQSLRNQYPNWWVKATTLGDQSARALPRVS
ncbi:MAG: 4-(cytidine 5'-diphospho)-2-C-methyl-D-erythritol kinase [Pseudomonadota bacterium]